MSEGNGKLLAVGDLREVRRQLAELPAKRKLELLLESPDPLALVQALPEQELFQAILEIGPADSHDLISLASPEQFIHFVDRSAWPRSDQGPASTEVLRWLTLARQTANQSDQSMARFREKLAGLDSELLELVMREQLIVHDIVEGVDLPVADWGRTWRTPEGKYLVEFAEGGADYGTLKQLLEDLFAEEPFLAARLLEDTRWAVPSELAEISRRWRDGRLRDHGFPTLEEALSFYARPARRASVESTGANTPGTSLSAPSGNLLERALQLVPAADWARVEEAVMYASNAALVAGGVAADDPFAARVALGDARNLLSLGLEVLAGNDATRAAALLAERPVREIFQAGMGELYALQSRARLIAQSARLPGAKTATLLGSPWSDLIDALGRKRPSLPDPQGKAKVRAPASRADVAAAEARLDEAAAIVQLLEKLGIGPAALAPLAEAAGIAASALNALDALRAKARAELLGQPGVLFWNPELVPPSQIDIGPSSEAIAHKLVELLDAAANLVGTGAAKRAAEALKSTR